MPVHHLVVAWPPPIHQPVLFFQLLPLGLHRAGHLPRSQPIAVTPTLDCIHELPLWFPSFPPALQLHPQDPLSKNIHDPSSTRPNQLSPPFLTLSLIQLSKFDNLIFIQRMMVYNPYRGACYIWRHLYLSSWGKPSLRRCEDSRAGTENWAHLWMNETQQCIISCTYMQAVLTRSLWTVQPCCVCLLCWCMK